MNWTRLAIAALGVAVFCAGAIVLLVPGAGGSLPVDAAVEVLGYDYLLVAVLGVVAFAVTLPVMALRAVGGLDQATPPDPEGIETVPRFGADVDAILEEGPGIRTRLLGDRGRAVRERFREAAVRTVARVERCDHAEARRRVTDGTWTDDPSAAAFLSEDGAAPISAALRGGLRAALGGETPFQRRARRTAEAIVALAEGSDERAYRDLRDGESDSAGPSDRDPDEDQHRGQRGSSGASRGSEVSA